MTRLSIATPTGASGFQPLGKVYDRATKDGNVPITTFLIGSQYNIIPDGTLNAVTDGTYMASNTMTTASSKLQLAGQSNSAGNTGKNIASYSTFTYLYPKTKIVGHSELAVSTTSGSPKPVHRIRYKYEDIITTDALIVDWEVDPSTGANAVLNFRQKVNGVESVLGTYSAPAGDTQIYWEIRYLEEGVTKLYYKRASGTRTRLYRGSPTADLAECKCSVEYWTSEATVRTVKSDFMFIWYPSAHLQYQASLANLLLGNCKVFDTKNLAEASWVRVYSGDHEFKGNRIIENGLLRMEITTDPKIKFYGWNVTNSAYEYIGALIPVDSNENFSTTLHDVLFTQLTKSRMAFTVKFGIIDFVIDFHRGSPYARIRADTKRYRFETNKARLALSADYANEKLVNWNQETSDDSGKGNPLNLSNPVFQATAFQASAFMTTFSNAVNPYPLTNDTNATTGIQNINDNWFAFYDIDKVSDTVGFIGVLKKPTGITIKGATASALEYVEYTFDKNMAIGVGMLEASTGSKIAGIPLAFHIGTQDTYVKWRANESVTSFGQRQFARRKR